MKLSNEVKVGIMFILGIALFIFILSSFTKFGGQRGGYEIEILFTDAGGLTVGTDVRLSGVKIGNVSYIGIDSSSSKALVRVKVFKDVALYDNYAFNLGMGGIIGEKFVDIKPNDPAGNKVKAGDTVNGASLADINKLIGSATDLVEQLNEATKTINDVLGDEETVAQFKGILTNLNTTTLKAGELTAILTKIATDNHKKVNVIADNLMVISTDAKKISHSLAKVTEGDFATNISLALRNVASLTQRADNIAAQLEVLGQDGKMVEDLNKMIDNLNSSTYRLANILANVESGTENLPEISDNLNTTLKGLPAIIDSLNRNLTKFDTITDNFEKSSADLPAITGEIKKATPELIENVLDISRSLKGVGDSVETIAATVTDLNGNLPSIKIDPDISLQVAPSGKNNSRSDLNFNLYYGDDNMFRGGVADLSDKSKFNAQLGKRVSDSSFVRYGIIESSFGAGFDQMLFNNNMRFSVDAFVPSSGFDTNLLLDYRVPSIGHSNNFWLSGGWYNMLSGNSYVGVGVRYFPNSTTKKPKEDKQKEGDKKDTEKAE